MRRLGLVLPLAVGLSVSLAAACSGPGGDTGPAGLPGPTGTPDAFPRIDAVFPSVGSLHNLITVEGTGFSSALSGNDVRFGAGAAVALVAGPTSLRVTPPPSGLALGPQPVTVRVADVTSAPAGFTLVDSGTSLPMPYRGLVSPGKPLALPDGRILVPDRAGVMAVATNGLVTLLAPSTPAALALGSSASVLVFDQQGLLRLSLGSGALDVLRWGTSYLGGSQDPSGNVYLVDASGGVDLLAANGSYTAGWATLPAATVAADAQFLGGAVYIVANGTAKGVYKVAAPAGGVATPLVTAGVNTLRSISTDGVTLLSAGNFVIAASNQEAAVTIDPAAGTITPIVSGRFSSIRGVSSLRTGYALSDGDGAVEVFATGGFLRVRAGAATHAGSLFSIGTSSYGSVYMGAAIPGWVFELNLDGSTRLVAQGGYGELAAGDDPQHLLGVRPDFADVVSLRIADGTTSERFAISSAQMTGPAGLDRDSLGNYYVASPGTGVVWKYSSAGVPGASAYTTLSGASHLRVAGAGLFVCRPPASTVTLVDLTSASTSDYVVPQEGLSAPSASIGDRTDPTGSRSYLIDGSGGQVWLVEPSGTTSLVTPVGQAFPARALGQTTDGMLVVTGDNGPQRITP